MLCCITLPIHSQTSDDVDLGFRFAPLPSWAQSTVSHLDFSDLKKDDDFSSLVFGLETLHCPSGTNLFQRVYQFRSSSDQFKNFCHAFQAIEQLTVHELYILRGNRKISLRDNLQSSKTNTIEKIADDTLKNELKVCWRLPPLQKGDFFVVSFSNVKPSIRSSSVWSWWHTAPLNSSRFYQYQVIACPGDSLFSYSTHQTVPSQISYGKTGPKAKISAQADPGDYFTTGQVSWLHRYPRYYYSNSNSWAEINQHFRQQFECSLPLSDTIQQVAHRLIPGNSIPSQKAELIFDHVKSEFAMTPTDDYSFRSRLKTLKNRGGDYCSVSLLLADLLRSTGMEVTPVLVQEEGFFRGMEDFPTSTRFNHIVLQVRIDGSVLWMDLLSEHALLPALANYRYGLPLSPSQSGLVKIPYPIPAQILIQDEVISLDQEDIPEMNRTVTLMGKTYQTHKELLLSQKKERESGLFTLTLLDELGHLYQIEYDLDRVRQPHFRPWDSLGDFGQIINYDYSIKEELLIEDSVLTLRDHLTRSIWDFSGPIQMTYENDEGEEIHWVPHKQIPGEDRTGFLKLPDPVTRFLNIYEELDTRNPYSSLPFPFHSTYELTIPFARVDHIENDTFVGHGPNMRYKRWTRQQGDTAHIYQQLVTLDAQLFREQYQELDSFNTLLYSDGLQVPLKLLEWKEAPSIGKLFSGKYGWITWLCTVFVILGLWRLVMRRKLRPRKVS